MTQQGQQAVSAPSATGRRRGRWRFVALTCAIGLAGSVVAWPAGPSAAAPGGAAAQDNMALQWNKAVLEGVRRSRLAPPVVARAMAIVHTCMFDAWSAYDQKAVGTQLGSSLRRPPNERRVANKNEAISYAAYRAASELVPTGAAQYQAIMAAHGYDPADMTTDTATPAGIGNVACQAVLDVRHHDGSNQLGDVNGGAPYSDYTGYAPVNQVMDLSQPFDPATVVNPDRWQPLRYVDKAGATVTPSWALPHWSKVTPFALTSASQFRNSQGPLKFGTPEFVDQAKDLLEVSANLTDREKSISEYWSGGPASETPPGHWNLLAASVSARDHHGLTEDIQMFFALNNALFDAGISSWDNKITFDCVRPITAIRYLFAGQQVEAWGGPNMGTTTIDGATWFPYQPTSFPTPPFGEYTSGHSTFSAAAAEVLRRFTGSDRFGGQAVIKAGSSAVEPGTPAADVVLSWDTFTAAATEAGMSRRYGGIHFEFADRDGRAGGRQVGAVVWEKARSYIKGQ